MTVYFGENMKSLRIKREMTQETLANFLGVTFQTVSKWERGETYPGITMLPVIAMFFNTTTDELLGVNKCKKEEKINEYLGIYETLRYKDSAYTFEKLQEAVKEFPGEYRLLVRYMELLTAEKTDKDNMEYEKSSQELLSAYETIQNHCTDDSIRIWAKRLICQHLHAKAYITGIDIYQQQAEAILDEMPELTNTKEYLSTMILADNAGRHLPDCGAAIEKLLYLLGNAINHYCFSQTHFPHNIKSKPCTKCSLFSIYFTRTATTAPIGFPSFIISAIWDTCMQKSANRKKHCNIFKKVSNWQKNMTIFRKRPQGIHNFLRIRNLKNANAENPCANE